MRSCTRGVSVKTGPGRMGAAVMREGGAPLGSRVAKAS